MIARARDLFVRYGDEISAALLLCALPESYAAEWGAPVLIAHGDLVWQLPRRIRQTALFLLAVLTDNDMRVALPGTPTGQPGSGARVLRCEEPAQVINTESTLFQQCVWLRLFHAGIREDLGGDAAAQPGNTLRNAPPSVPLNQEDLLATLLSFSVTALRVLEALGIAVDDADREAYVFLWNLVGACLGVGSPAVGYDLDFLVDGTATTRSRTPSRSTGCSRTRSRARTGSSTSCRRVSGPRCRVPSGAGARSPGPTSCPAGRSSRRCWTGSSTRCRRAGRRGPRSSCVSSSRSPCSRVSASNAWA